MKSGRKAEIMRMIDNEFLERKDLLIKKLESTENAEEYVILLNREKEAHNAVYVAIEHYFQVK